MKDNLKTKAQLIQEIEQLRDRISKLETVSNSNSDPKEPSNQNHLNQIENSRGFSGLIMDVTDTKQAEEALAYKAMMLDNILRSASDVAIATTDMDLIITYYNPMAEHIFGYTAQEVIGKTVMEIHLKENVSPDRLERAIDIVRQTGEYKYSLVQETASGPRHLSSRVSSILNSDGDMVGFCLFSRDVTEKVLSDQILEDNIALLKSSQSLAHIGSWENDLITGDLVWSDEVYRILGEEPQAFKATYKAFLDFIHPEDRDLVNEAYTSSIRDGRDSCEIEHRIIRRESGEIRIVLEQCEHHRDSSGKINRSIGLVKDVTDRKSVEIKLYESERMYRLVTENSLHGMFKVDAEGIMTFVNQAVADLTGYSQMELDGLPINMLFPLGEAKDISNANLVLLQSGKTISGNNTLTRKDSTPVEAHFSCVPLFDDSGCYTGFIGSIMDLTERLEAEKALMASRENYRSLVESTADWVWAIDLKGSYTFSNNSIKTLLGYDVNEILGELAFPKMHPDDLETARALVANGIRTKQGWRNVEVHWLHKDGSVCVFESSARPLFGLNGEITGFSGIDRDITEHKKAQEALLKSEFDMRTLFNAMTDIVFEMDYDGRYINIAPTSPELMYVPVEKAIDRTVHQVFPKFEADMHLALVRRCIDENKTLTIEYPLTFGSRTIWFEGRATPKTDHSVLFIASDITKRKQLEEQVKHRLIALTQPEIEFEELALTDVLGLELLQSLQDSFANAFKIPSVIFSNDGESITIPSHFTSFCKLVRSTAEGEERCRKYRKELVNSLKKNQSQEIRQGCVLNNMVTGSVPIVLQGRHLAYWEIGQLINSSLDYDEIRKYATEIDVDSDELVAAAETLVHVDLDFFQRAIEFLSTLSSHLSLLALQNLQQGRDIAARDAAEEALLSERRMFVAGPTVVFRWGSSENWPVEYVSPNVESVFGIKPEEFTSGKVPFASVIYPDDLQRVGAEVTAYTVSNTDFFEQEYRIVRSDGVVRWILDYTAITRDENGTATHYDGYIIDNTHRKEAQIERERLMMAIEQAAETILITDLHGTIEYVNPAFEKITGFSRDEVIGQNPSILKSGMQDDTFFMEIWETIKSGRNWKGRIINRKKDGSLYTEEATISPVRNPSGAIINYVAVKRDITMEVKLEEQLRQAQKMEAVGQLAGGVAHDFNNLLQVMNGYTELVMAEINQEHSAYEFIQEIAKAGDRAQSLVSQLLSFSRRQIINPVDLDLNEVTEKLMKMIRRVIGEHIQCEFIPGHELGTIQADSGQMEQILMNLCVNSRDALADGGKIFIETGNVLIDAEYAGTHPWAKPGRYVLLSVTDDGCGMDKKTIASIFDPFFTTKSIGKGTGLGMSTVYGIVKQHKGEIQVYSELGKGTVFKIYLPVVARRAGDIASQVDAPVVGGSETILVAEDDDMVRNLTRQTLVMAGYTVIDARNGNDALSLFVKHADRVNLLMLDVVMPGLGGKEVYDRIRETHPDVPTLFCSGYNHNGIHTRFVFNSDLHFLQKPYSSDLLLRKIRKILDS